jgi:ATP-dependent protease HslVU (ClpYQ) peptidase subunit
MSKLKNTYGFSDDVLKAVLDIHVNEAALSSKQKKIAKLAGDPDIIDTKDLKALRSGRKPVEEARTALDKTYPHGANDIATLAVQVRALLNFLSKSGVLKK